MYRRFGSIGETHLTLGNDGTKDRVLPCGNKEPCLFFFHFEVGQDPGERIELKLEEG